MATYDVGDRPRTTITFKVDGVVVDPAKVVLIVKSPNAEQRSVYNGGGPHQITRSALGVYFADIPLLSGGKWAYRWVALDSSDVPLDACEREINVSVSKMAAPI